MKAKKRKPQKHSFILTLALLLAAGYFVISFISAQLEIREKETSEPIGKTTDTDENPSDLRGDTALS